MVVVFLGATLIPQHQKYSAARLLGWGAWALSHLPQAVLPPPQDYIQLFVTSDKKKRLICVPVNIVVVVTVIIIIIIIIIIIGLGL